MTVYSSGSEPKVETWQTLCRLFHEDKKAQGPVVAKKQTEQMVGLSNTKNPSGDYTP